MNCPICGESLDTDFTNGLAACRNRRCPICHLVVPQSACLLLAEEPCRHGARQAFCAECDSAREEPLRTEGGPTIQEQQENARRFK